jgi:hypothetical protein
LTIDTAEAHYQPGVFTSFIASHLHRNAIYRSNNVASIPFSSLDSSRPEDLWQFLHQQN